MERRDNPGLDGKPIIVCPTSNLSPKALKNSTSEISSASYEARAKGIKSRMFLKDAYALCPDAIFIPCNYKRYEQTSDLFYQVLRKYSTTLQPISADEAALNLSFALDSDNKSTTENFIQKIRDDILDLTGCPCSCGVGPNLLIAKLAISKAKPNGQKIFIEKSEISEFLTQISIEQLPKVGEVMAGKLHALGVYKVSDLLHFPQVVENKKIFFFKFFKFFLFFRRNYKKNLVLIKVKCFMVLREVLMKEILILLLKENQLELKLVGVFDFLVKKKCIIL